MDYMNLAVMPLFLSPEIDKQLLAQAPASEDLFNQFVINLLTAGAAKALTPGGAATLEPLPQVLTEHDKRRQHILRVEAPLYTRLKQLEDTLHKDRAVLLQHFIRQGLTPTRAAIPA